MSQSEASREDRELPASERRLEQAREQGQVPRSRDLGHVAVAAFVLLLAACAGWLAPLAAQGVARSLHFGSADLLEPTLMPTRLGSAVGEGLLWLLPLLLLLAAGLALAAIALGGLNLSAQPLAPRLDRLDPVAGLGRLVDRRHLLVQMRLVVQVIAVLGVAAAYALAEAGGAEQLARIGMPAAIAAAFEWLRQAGGPLLAVCIACALIDVPLQLWQHGAQLRMTREEVRQEHKESEGDPQVRGERRRRARDLARGRMMTAVPQADVVVTNPTHYAVALRYDAATMRAPVIVALGTDLLAQRIRELAREHGVPQLEAPPLARALHAHGDLDAEVPVALYTAVAQVLAWVMRLRDAAQAAPAAPAIEVPPGLDPMERGV